MVMGPKGCNDHGFLRVANDICTMEDVLLADTIPSVMLMVCEVIGGCIPHGSDDKSVPYINISLYLLTSACQNS